MGQHKERADAAHGNKTPAQIRADNCAKCHARALARKEERRKKAEGLWHADSPKEQLARLDRSFGKGQGAKKERVKLTLRIHN